MFTPQLVHLGRAALAAAAVLLAASPAAALPAAPASSFEQPFVQKAREIGILQFSYVGALGIWQMTSEELARWEEENGCRSCAYNIFSTIADKGYGLALSGGFEGLRFIQLPPELLALLTPPGGNGNNPNGNTGTGNGNGESATPSLPSDTTPPATDLPDTLPPPDLTDVIPDPGAGNGDGNGGSNVTPPGGETALVTVPEPLTLALFGAGLAGVGALRRRTHAR